MFLCHFNPYHDKLGRFTNSSGHFIFVSGSSKTTDKDSIYYRKELTKNVKDQINKYVKNNDVILLGDAPGIDSQVQDYLKDIGYKNVLINTVEDKDPRYISDRNWPVNHVDGSGFVIGSKEWLALKDVEMTNISDEGYAIILDEGSRATRKNIQRLLNQNKNVVVSEVSKRGKEFDRTLDNPDYNALLSTLYLKKGR